MYQRGSLNRLVYGFPLTEMGPQIAGRQQTHIILVSLMSFSDITLRYGHTFGNSVLYELAHYLDRLYPDGRAFRTSNMVFGLTLPWVSQSQADAQQQIAAVPTWFRAFIMPSPCPKDALTSFFREHQQDLN